MIEVTKKANEMIKGYLKGKEEISSLRIILMEGGWSGSSLGLALDELHDKDETFENDEITYVINKELFDQVKPIKIEHVNTPMGPQIFISSSMKKNNSCCESCSSCWKVKDTHTKTGYDWI